MTTILDPTAVKSELNIPTSTGDTAIAAAISAATELIESQEMCGPFDVQTYTEVLDGCGTLVLTRGPVIDLTSVEGEVYGPVDVSLLAVNPTGILRPKRMQVVLFDDYYTVTYTYGRSAATVPDTVKQAALVICKSILSIRKGPTARPSTGGTETATVPGYPYPVPTAALSMLEPYRLGPSVG